MKYIKQISQALLVVHQQGLLHRDVKQFDDLSRPTLIDFSVAWEKNSSGTPMGRGKQYYAPPEQWNNHKFSSCSDLYSLGVTAIFLLTGKHPSWLINHNNSGWKWQCYVSVSEKTATIINKMIETEYAISGDSLWRRSRSGKFSAQNVHF